MANARPKVEQQSKVGWRPCKAGRALQGANFWTWAGERRAGNTNPHSTGTLAGDPFCVPQGLNSVFDTDTSMLAVVAQANEQLAALAR